VSQVTDYEITGGPSLTMAELKVELDAMFAAVASANRGTTAPDNPFEGMTWQDSNTTPVEYIKKYTATFGWVILASVNITTGAYTPYRSGIASGTAAITDTGVATGNVPLVNQAVTATTRATTTTLGTTLNHTLSDTSATITAFNGVAGVTYHCRALGAGEITHHGTNLIIRQTGASITTAADDTFDVYMITDSTCEIRNIQLASGSPLVEATGGKVLQVVPGSSTTETSTTSTSYVTTTLTATITPTLATSTILVLVDMSTSIYKAGDDDVVEGSWQLYRGAVGGTSLGIKQMRMGRTVGTGGSYLDGCMTFMVLDEPATAAPQSYTVGFSTDGTVTAYSQRYNYQSNITLIEIGA